MDVVSLRHELNAVFHLIAVFMLVAAMVAKTHEHRVERLQFAIVALLFEISGIIR